MFSSDITLNLPIGGTNLVLKGHAGMTPNGIEVTITDVSFDGTAPAKPAQGASKRRPRRNAAGGRVIRSRVARPATDETVVEGFDDFDNGGYGVDDDELAGLERLVKFGPNTL